MGQRLKFQISNSVMFGAQKFTVKELRLGQKAEGEINSENQSEIYPKSYSFFSKIKFQNLIKIMIEIKRWTTVLKQFSHPKFLKTLHNL